jgi:hypothetical protein
VTRGFLTPAFAAATILLTPASRAGAVDKQGSAHGGDIEGAQSGVALSGSLMLGSALYNPSYAARPDNSGISLMRYAGHADLDLIGRRLSIPLDVNMFTDRERDGAAMLAPTELDVITGLTSTWALGPGALELGTRFEHDRPVDRGGANQSYVDARARYLYSLAKLWPALERGLRKGDIGGYLTFGWFAYNRSYFARPDNTGKALFRYAVHSELSILDDLISFGIDATMFTDKAAPNPARPSELDLTPELIFHHGDLEAHLALEIDRPIDRGGLVQKFVYVLAIWNFSLAGEGRSGQPFEERGQVLSP